jgi:hypothetical protein
MRKAPNVRIEQNRILGPAGTNRGAAVFRRHGVLLRVIFSDELGWDHVSVSLDQHRCPTWDEMCWIKEQFFEEEEFAIQFHPRKSEYVNKHEHVLHLWRPHTATGSQPKPPLECV